MITAADYVNAVLGANLGYAASHESGADNAYQIHPAHSAIGVLLGFVLSEEEPHELARLGRYHEIPKISLFRTKAGLEPLLRSRSHAVNDALRGWIVPASFLCRSLLRGRKDDFPREGGALEPS